MAGFLHQIQKIAQLVLDLFRGHVRRHKALLYFACARKPLFWKWKVSGLRRRNRGAPVILISLVEHLGDIVAAEPIARYLRDENPDAVILWAIRKQFRDLVEHNPAINGILTVGCLSEWICMADHKLFDKVYDLHVPGRECPLCRWKWDNPSAGGDVNLRNYFHFGNLLQIFCQVAGLAKLDDAPQLYIPRHVRSEVDAIGVPRNFVTIHCRSNRVERDWITAKWQALTEQIIAKYAITVVEVGLEPVVNHSGRGYVNLCGKLSVLQTAEVIRRSALFVGIDSGPAHLANAAGTYGVILMGHFGPFKTYVPYSGDYASGSNADVIHADGPAASISVERVLQSVEQRLYSAKSELL